MRPIDEDLPLLSASEEAHFITAIEAAWRPTELSNVVNERLIEQALLDPLAPPTAEELAESARLRDALEHGSSHEDAATLAALRTAFGAGEPGEPATQVEEADRALAARPRRGNVVYAVFGVASAIVAAAAVALLFSGTTLTDDAPEPSAAALSKPRSTAPLFNERFETADTTARMDAIATARSRDLRDNRYAAWGVR